MDDEKQVIIERFESFGVQLCGDKHGWKKKFSELLGISPLQLSNLLAGRDTLGGKMQQRLRDLGADVEYILGARGDEPDMMIQVRLPAHIKRDEAVKYRRVLEEMLKVSKYDPEVADKILIIMETTLVKKEAPAWPDVTKMQYEVKRYKKTSTDKVKHDK